MCVKLLTIKRCVGHIVHRAYRRGKFHMIIYVRGFSVHLIDVMIPTMMSLVLYNAYSLLIQHCMLSNICRASDNLMHRMTELINVLGF